MPLNQEQQAAVEYLEGPLLVLAGPGTGKTQLLSAKVAYILEHTDANPENILCLTFTDAGAENMRDRLQTMIGEAALSVNTYTYHAFGANLLDRYKTYAETLDRKLDAPIDQTVQYKIVADLQKKLPATDILKSAATKDLVDTIANAKSARLTAADLRKIAETNIEDSNAISAELSPIFLGAPARCKFDVALTQIYQPTLEILAKYTSPDPIAGSIERTANTMARELNSVIDEAASAAKPSVQPLSAWKRKYLETRETDAGISYRLSDTIANRKLLSLAGVMESYDQHLRANGLFDFSDMIEYAIHYLKTDPGFRANLSELFQYVLLDEFQDTNTSQFELIRLLTDYEKPIIMAVGDDDQAIYEFQGANASNLMDFQKHFDAKIITLIKNYRSNGEVLALSQKIAAQINDSFAKNYQIDKNLHSMQDEWNGAPKWPQISRHEFPSSEAEYFWIAQKIRDLIDGGEDPTEIAILAPKHKNIIPLLPYLKAQHLDITYEKRDNLLQDAKIRPLLTLARFISALASGLRPLHQLLEILSFDFWQIPPAEVIRSVEFARNDQSSATKSTLDYLAGEPKLASLGNFFAALATKSATVPLELWLDYLIGARPLDGWTSPYLAYFQKTASDAELLEFYDGLSTLRQTVLAHAKNLHPSQPDLMPTLADFVATLDDYESAGSEIMRISTYRDTGQAIQVMTAFKSKGLEFKHVFLTSVDDAAWGKAKGNNNLLALPKNLVQIRHTGISDDEKLRVFFVAVTRAKQSLYLTNARVNASGKEIHRLSYLQEESRESASNLSPFLPESAQNIQIHAQDLSSAEKIETKRLNWISAYQQNLPDDILPLLRARMSSYRLSASDLTSFIDLTFAGPEKTYQRRVLHAPDEPANFSIYYGNLLHATFEQITNQKLDDAAALEFFQSNAAHVALEPEERQNLIEKGTHSLEIALREFRSIIRHEHAKAEVNLASERPVLDNVPLTGKIDHIELDPAAKTLEIYDYKTGSPHSGKWNSDPTLYKYRLQLGFYKLLLNLSPTYHNYKISRGHILFVSADEKNDNQVFDAVYEYNDDDERELKQLVKAVYYQLTTLDFVNDPELFLPPDENARLPQIHAFVEKVLEKSQKSSDNTQKLANSAKKY